MGRVVINVPQSSFLPRNPFLQRALVGRSSEGGGSRRRSPFSGGGSSRSGNRGRFFAGGGGGSSQRVIISPPHSAGGSVLPRQLRYVPVKSPFLTMVRRSRFPTMVKRGWVPRMRKRRSPVMGLVPPPPPSSRGGILLPQTIGGVSRGMETAMLEFFGGVGSF